MKHYRVHFQNPDGSTYSAIMRAESPDYFEKRYEDNPLFVRVDPEPVEVPRVGYREPATLSELYRRIGIGE